MKNPGKDSLQFELLNTYCSKIACKMSHTPKFISRASLLLPLAQFPFVSQSSFGILRLQLNWAVVQLIVTRRMMGTFPVFSLLLFT